MFPQISPEKEHSKSGRSQHQQQAFNRTKDVMSLGRVNNNAFEIKEERRKLLL